MDFIQLIVWPQVVVQLLVFVLVWLVVPFVRLTHVFPDEPFVFGAINSIESVLLVHLIVVGVVFLVKSLIRHLSLRIIGVESPVIGIKSFALIGQLELILDISGGKQSKDSCRRDFDSFGGEPWWHIFVVQLCVFLSDRFDFGFFGREGQELEGLSMRISDQIMVEDSWLWLDLLLFYHVVDELDVTHLFHYFFFL